MLHFEMRLLNSSKSAYPHALQWESDGTVRYAGGKDCTGSSNNPSLISMFISTSCTANSLSITPLSHLYQAPSQDLHCSPNYIYFTIYISSNSLPSWSKLSCHNHHLLNRTMMLSKDVHHVRVLVSFHLLVIPLCSPSYWIPIIPASLPNPSGPVQVQEFPLRSPWACRGRLCDGSSSGHFQLRIDLDVLNVELVALVSVPNCQIVVQTSYVLRGWVKVCCYVMIFRRILTQVDGSCFYEHHCHHGKIPS